MVYRKWKSGQKQAFPKFCHELPLAIALIRVRVHILAHSYMPPLTKTICRIPTKGLQQERQAV